MNAVVCITGAASGLGQALSAEYARRGARLLLADKNQEGLYSWADQLRAGGSEVLAQVCDVTQEQDVESLLLRACQSYGGLDIMINNAGVAVAGPVSDVPMSDWRWVMDINLFGVVHGCRAAARIMQAQGHGQIINIASMAGLLNPPEMAAYNASKAAVLSLSESLAAELAHQGIKVLVVCPGFFSTGLGRSLRSTRAHTGAALEKLMQASQIDAKDIAKAIVAAAERGEPILLPHAEGRRFWRVKRWWPQLFARRMQEMGRRMAQKAEKGSVEHA